MKNKCGCEGQLEFLSQKIDGHEVMVKELMRRLQPVIDEMDWRLTRAHQEIAELKRKKNPFFPEG